MESRSPSLSLTQSRWSEIFWVWPPLVVTAIRRALIFIRPSRRASATVRML